MSEFRHDVIFCFLGLLVWLTSLVEGKFQVQCYLPSWALNNDPVDSFKVTDLDPYGPCDVILYAFFKVADNKLASHDGKYRGHFAQLSILKSKNPDLRVMLSVGGWNNSREMTTMAGSAVNRSTFIASVVPNLRRFNMDGLDIDWEFPKAVEAHNYIALLKELREAFESEARRPTQDRLLLTAAVGNTVQTGYLAKEMNRWLDVVNVMTYDYHMYGSWDLMTGHNAALTDTVQSVLAWETAGIANTSLSLGIPFYARSYTVAPPTNVTGTIDFLDVGTSQPASGPGQPGVLTHENGTLSYAEVCSSIKNGWTSGRDKSARAPYARSADQWVSYDDAQSVTDKVVWAQEHGLQGVFIWHLGVDDVHGYCGRKFPLLNAVDQALIKPNVIPNVPPIKSASAILCSCAIFILFLTILQSYL
ncbi:Acidic mammalian chitinase [Hypsibius exemplaris]|uniref:Acidic mammalian chitinase n=1 Tax=Hypsibius exemplaris TaxID=2072580 RepID=A0A1W0XEN3_HYPEX|nr:Acidic mammalian chitinase [Hypsibius exemplaris]